MKFDVKFRRVVYSHLVIESTDKGSLEDYLFSVSTEHLSSQAEITAENCEVVLITPLP